MNSELMRHTVFADPLFTQVALLFVAVVLAMYSLVKPRSSQQLLCAGLVVGILFADVVVFFTTV